MLTIIVSTVCFGIVFATFFEWTLHRFVMHKPVGKFRYPFERHAVIHHGIFKADHTYHLIDEKDKNTIPMACWHGPTLSAIGASTVFLFKITSWFENWEIWLMAMVLFCVFFVYYSIYEYIHWCMHLPKKRNIERTGVFFRLNGHHLLHHRYMHKNFNVVLPLADLCLGTLLPRSKVMFAQAKGPSVPNVQPK